MGLGERIGRYDDESVFYRADDPEQKVHWKRIGVTYVVGSILAGAAIAGAGAFVRKEAASLGTMAAGVVLVVGYIIWRRRRNRRLTGSPTTWRR